MKKRHACKECGRSEPDVKFGWRTVAGKRYKKFLCNQCLHIYNRRFKKDVSLADNRKKRYEAKKKEERRLGLNRARWIREDAAKADRKRGLKSDLTVEFIESLITAPCTYCGESNLQMTLDRIDNSAAHTKDNVLGSCIRCNMMRRDMPYEAWLLLISSIRRIRKLGLFGEWTGSIHKSRCSSGGLERGIHNPEGESSNDSTATKLTACSSIG